MNSNDEPDPNFNIIDNLEMYIKMQQSEEQDKAKLKIEEEQQLADSMLKYVAEPKIIKPELNSHSHSLTEQHTGGKQSPV